MPAQFLDDVDLNYGLLLRARLDNVSADPSSLTSSEQGYALFRNDTRRGEVWNGQAFDRLSGGVVEVAGTAGSGTVQAVTATLAPAGTGRLDTLLTISTSAASATNAGSMSASDFTKLANSTATNVASSLVQRDGSGNFAAGVITARLNGTAVNAETLDAQAPSYYLSRANHTGTQTASTISNFDSQVRTNRLDQLSAPTGAVNLNSQRITSLADPINPSDAATKNYVDSAVQGLDVKGSVRAATTGNIDLASIGLGNVDGITLRAGDRVLVKNQTNASQNGIYVAANGPWARAADMDTTAEASPGAFTFVEEGATYADSGWVMTADDTVTLGSTALTWVQFSGAGSYTAGNGLTLDGTSFRVVGTADRITVSAAGVNIASTYVGQASITTLGTITAGTWNGTTIAVANGGTGATTPAAARNSLGATTKAVGTITGNGTATTFNFAHNLGTAGHTLQMVDAAGNVTYADFTLGANTDTVSTARPIGNGVVYTLTAVG